jgi:hypothetical protein
MVLSGQLIDVQHSAGSFIGRSGESINYENAVVKVFDGHEVVSIKVKGEGISHALGLRGQDGVYVDIDVDSPREVQTRTFAASVRPAASKS